jgi:hypothetical protein
MVCERCKVDIAVMKTFDFISNDLHYAKCAYGTLTRVELADALNNPMFKDDKDFVDLYIDDYDNLRGVIRASQPAP